ncbi:hypothetical protein D918_04931 [Trichuris suis]|nr:hypothetical protein D918_04931 [Trichuris suis]
MVQVEGGCDKLLFPYEKGKLCAPVEAALFMIHHSSEMKAQRTMQLIWFAISHLGMMTTNGVDSHGCVQQRY